MNNLVCLEQLVKVYENDEIESKYVKKAIGYIIESAKWFNEEVDYPEDIDNFNGFLDGCREYLDFLLGEDDVEEALQLRDLYEEYFGIDIATKYREMRTINEAIIDCLLNMVYDYGI